MKTLEQLQKENEELKAKLKNSETKVEDLEKLNQWYMEQLKLKRKKMFGASSEKTEYDNGQLSFFNEAESVAAENPIQLEPTEDIMVVPKKKKSKRGASFENLPVETIEYKLEETEQTCVECKHPLHVMKKEVRKELKFIPAQFKMVEHITFVYACRNCEKEGIKGNIVTAKSTKALLPKSFVSASLLSNIMYQKYTNAMPLDRQEKDFKRLGLQLSRQNLSNWVIKGAKLLEPLQALMKKELISNQILHADETVLEVLNEPGRDAKTNSYMWLYRTSGVATNQVVLYDYTMGRGGVFPKKYLDGFNGYLHTDGYAGYHQLEPTITLCGCWAHARRKFDEALKILKPEKRAGSLEEKGLHLINQLFSLEKSFTELEPVFRLQNRVSKSQKILDEFYDFVEANSSNTLPQSLLGKAITYVQNQQKYLLSFMKDGGIELSNNRAERSIKPFVIGRKNWLFSNTPSGAKSSAIIYSILQTAIENGLQPQAYLQYVFKQIQLEDIIDYEALLPWSANIPEACKLN